MPPSSGKELIQLNNNSPEELPDEQDIQGIAGNFRVEQPVELNVIVS